MLESEKQATKQEIKTLKKSILRWKLFKWGVFAVFTGAILLGAYGC